MNSHCTGDRDQDHSQEKEMQERKWLSEKALQIAVKRREAKRREREGEKERYTHLNAEFQRIARRHKKAFLSDQCKETEEKIQCGRVGISTRRLEISREHFMPRWAQ